MKKYNVYHPESFGMRGSPDTDESYALFAELDERGQETGSMMLAYIYSDDIEVPASVDLDNAEEFVMQENAAEGLTPVFSGLAVAENGEMTLPARNEVFMLTQDQFRMLVDPLCVRTERGICWLDEHEKRPVFRLDESLETVPAKRLDMRKFNAAVGSRWPALLEKTHCFCGKHYPEFPNIKYFEDRDKAVLFMTADQIRYLSDGAVSGASPLFRDFSAGHDWDIKNIYGVCIIDDSRPEYGARLVSPDKLLKYRDAVLSHEQTPEPPAEKTELPGR